MSRFSLRSKPVEVQKKVLETIKEITETKERNGELKVQLYNTLEMLGMEVDDSINCVDIGYTVKMVVSESERIVKEDLEALGVAPEQIEKATRRWQSKRHMRLTPKKYLSDDGSLIPKPPENKTYGGTNSGNEVSSLWR